MNIVIILILVLLLFGGGGWGYSTGWWGVQHGPYAFGGFGLVVVIILIVLAFR